jgi:hypothetical protein
MWRFSTHATERASFSSAMWIINCGRLHFLQAQGGHDENTDRVLSGPESGGGE